MITTRAFIVLLLLSRGLPAQDGEGLFTIGPAGTSGVDCTLCTSSEQGFLDAVDYFRQSGLGGGEIWILPGTYTFSAPVVLEATDTSDNPIRYAIHGTGDVVLRPGPTNTEGLFDVRGDGFLLSGVEVRDVDAPVTRSFLIRSSGDDCTVRDCTFRITQSGCDALGVVHVIDLGFADEPFVRRQPKFLRGLVEGNTFVFDAMPCGTARPFVGVRARNGFGLRLVGNRFLGVHGGQEARAALEGALVFHDMWFSVLSGNLFRNLDVSGGTQRTLALATNTSDGSPAIDEGHHSAFTNNIVRDCAADYAFEVRVDGQGFYTFTGNSFGGGTGAIHILGDLADSKPGQSNTIAGNRFENMGAVDGGSPFAAITLDFTHRAGVMGNQFVACRGTQIRIANGGRGIAINDNRFTLTNGQSTIQPPIDLCPDLTDANDLMIHGNAWIGSWPLDLYASCTGSLNIDAVHNERFQ